MAKQQPKIAGLTLKDEGEDAPRESTVKREAFFVDFAAAVRAAAKMPVMVWSYGGAFTQGSGTTPGYDGEALAKKGVVFVTYNYRLGPFGFYAHPELTKESGHNASGNYGVMDLHAALKWVQHNIAAFGGDPAQVTVFGESAGGGSVFTLLTSPLSQKLYQRAVIESGGGLDATATSDDEVQTRSFPNSFGRHQVCAGWEAVEAFDLPGNAGRVAEELELQVAGTRLLCENLGGMGILEQDGHTFSLPKRSRKWLDPAADTYIGTWLEHTVTYWEWYGDLERIVRDYANFNWIMTGTDTFACEGTSFGEHQDGAWRAGVTHAGRWCDVFEVRDFLIQRCFIYLDPDYAGRYTERYPWLAREGRDASVPFSLGLREPASAVLDK